MTTLAQWTEQWQHFTSDVREQFWGDLAQHTRQNWQDLLGRLSVEAPDRYLGVGSMNGVLIGPMPGTAFMPGIS